MKKLSRYLLFLSIITLFAVMITIIQQSYDKLISTQNKISSEIIIKQINSELDTSVLGDLEKKNEFLETDIVNTLSPQPTLTQSFPGF